jgi:hypothetical protein
MVRAPDQNAMQYQLLALDIKGILEENSLVTHYF